MIIHENKILISCFKHFSFENSKGMYISDNENSYYAGNLYIKDNNMLYPQIILSIVITCNIFQDISL